jgi:LmbE family N-acetylglucosaminyl deacetylase
MKFGKTALIILILLCISASLRLNSSAQIRPVYDQGALGLAQLLKRLNTSASALMIGAHPDDEDTALLAYLARGESARTAYLSLTRGDGGQNIIGPELGEALGVIRTEELLQARKLDGAEQFFTRAYDYGFSKTLAEAKEKWDEKIILCDVVRVIRQFRPLVVVSQFSGTPADGHGHHQYAGYISPLAVKGAADASQCSDSGPAWTVRKFYVRHGFRATGEPRLRINTGKYDPPLGRSYFEIAMEARSQHKSQEQGVLELRGDQFSGLNLVGSEAQESSIFDGLDTSFGGVGSNTGFDNDARKTLSEMQSIAEEAAKEFNPGSPERIILALVKGYSLAVQAGQEVPRDSPANVFFHQKAKLFAEAFVIAAGVQIDALADRETVVPGENVFVSVKGFIRSSVPVKIIRIGTRQPIGWTVSPTTKAPAGNNPAFIAREVASEQSFFNLTVPRNALPMQPYWLTSPRDGELYLWGGDKFAHTLPYEHRLRALVTLDFMGTEIDVDRPVEFRFADDTRGEIRRNVDVVPAISVDLDPTLLIVPTSDKPQTRAVTMNITNDSTKPVSGIASLNIESDVRWNVAPASKPFILSRAGEKISIEFQIAVPAATRSGSYRIAALADIGGSFAPLSMRTIAYPHIQTHRFYRRAITDIKVIDLKTAPAKVGYIRGSGDRVPEAIKQLGLAVEEIDERMLTASDLSKFDTIVVGIRAYQVRPDLVANNQRLLDFAKNGGTLIVQYQLPATFPRQNLAPFPVQLGPRVADENAPVTIVQPTHPIFNFPNKITSEDFKGWVQERNLYNFSTMDPKYVGLLESHDVGEAENKGGLVVADIGKGKYVYCSYSLFRQLPAGVPGAYRLLANMLSLPKAAR